MKSLFLREEKFYLEKLLLSKCIKVYNLISTELVHNTACYFTKRYDLSNNAGTVVSLFTLVSTAQLTITFMQNGI
jgi:hypothetical protein